MDWAPLIHQHVALFSVNNLHIQPSKVALSPNPTDLIITHSKDNLQIYSPALQWTGIYHTLVHSMLGTPHFMAESTSHILVFPTFLALKLKHMTYLITPIRHTHHLLWIRILQHKEAATWTFRDNSGNQLQRQRLPQASRFRNDRSSSGCEHVSDINGTSHCACALYQQQHCPHQTNRRAWLRWDTVFSYITSDPVLWPT